MPRCRYPFVSALAIAACILAAPIGAEPAEVAIVRQAAEVFRAISAVPEREVTDLLLKDAEGIAIIPGARKFGFIIGRQYGRGVLLARKSDGGWSDPVFVTLYAKGAFASLFEEHAGARYPDTRIIDNTSVYEIMREAAGIP